MGPSYVTGEFNQKMEQENNVKATAVSMALGE